MQTAYHFLGPLSPFQCQAARVESEVQEWAVQYRRAVDTHTRTLCASAARARERHQQRLDQKSRALDDRARHAVDAVRFAEEVSEA